ncbi:MAG: exo-alpha-sialidase [Ferruginibacter sp.]|nr:exo-alpha-sialidase [Ferruginibacter sp.]
MKVLNTFKTTLLFCLIFLHYSPADAQSYKWNTVAMGGGGFVSAIITSKTQQNLMFARTDVGGAYKWDNSNSRWKPLVDWASSAQTGYMGVESVAIDPLTPSRVYMFVGTSYFNGGNTAILRSTDYGETFPSIVNVTGQFRAHGNGMGRQNGEKLQVDPNNSNILYCGTRDSGLFRSFNMGATWTRVSSLNVRSTPNGNGISFVLFDPRSKGTTSSSQTIYVGVSRAGSTNLYVSKNGGTSFAGVSGAPTTYMPQRAALTPDSSNLFVTYANGAGPHANSNTGLNEPMNNGAVWRYTPSINTWSLRTPAGYAKPFSGISIDPNNSKRILLSTVNTYLPQYTAASGGLVYGDRILVSDNGGFTWKDPIANGMTLNSNGVTWVNGTNMHWVGSAEFDPFNTSKVWITSGQGVFSCDNINATNTTWKFNVNGFEETVPRDLVSITGGALVSVIYDYDGFKHSDVSQYAPRHNPTMGTTTGIAFAGTEKNTLLRTGSRQYYSTNQGASWTQCVVSKGGSGKVAVSANGFAFLHCPAGSTNTYRSIDKGTSWTTCAGGMNFSDAIPVADLVNAQNFYMYDNNSGAFWKSTDRGASFTNVANIGSGGSKIIRAVPDNDGDVWVALNGAGLKYTTDAGVNFTTVSGVSNCSAVGFGKAATGANYPAVYIWASVGGVTGAFRSTDKGVNWTRVNDDAHEYGGLGNGNFIMGSMNTYGRYFMSTVGRGIAYGDISTTTGGNRPALTGPVIVDNTDKTFKMVLLTNPVVTNSFEVSIVSDKSQTVQLYIAGVDGRLTQTQEVNLQTGANKVRVNEMSRKVPGVYMLSALSVDGKQQLASIKFLRQ